MIVENLSYTEQRNFKKTDYKKLVLNEMIEMLPTFDRAQLKETSHYISNALNNRVQQKLSHKTRESSNVTKQSSNTLSESLLNELDATLCIGRSQLDSGNVDDQSDKDDDNECYEFTKSITDESTCILNDSITKLKQTVTIEPKSDQKQTKTNISQKCCDTCTVKAKPRKSHPMTRCSFCMLWYHDQCVGLDKDEPVGVWLCSSCRQVPQGLQDNISEIKTDVEELKKSTKSITTAIHKLSEQVTSCVENINDKLTALCKRIDCNDRKTSETLDSIIDASDSLKTNFDQKTCQILNKTTTIIDKVKVHCDLLNYSHEQPNEKTTEKNKTNDKSITVHVNSNDKRSVQTTQKQPHNQTQITRKNDHKKRINTNNKPPNRNNCLHGPAGQKADAQEHETVDLTGSPQPKKVINQSTLLVGSSIFKNIRVNELKKNTAIRSFPGATVKSLQHKLNQFNLEKCETIIIHVGGNIADQGIDLDNFSDNYSSLLNDLISDSCQIIVSGLLPRESANLDPYNECLKTLCEAHMVDFVDHYKGFLFASGDLADSYFHRDKVHPNSFGIKKLLRNIDVFHRVTGYGANIKYSAPGKRRYSYPTHSNNSSYDRSYHNRQKYCHICSRKGHDTIDCWYNGRSTVSTGFRQR